MTREMLEDYKSTVRLIEKDKKRLKYWENNRPTAVFGKVKGSSKGFPFTERSFAVNGAYEQIGISEKDYNTKVQNLKCKIQDNINASMKEKIEVEQFIENIENKLHKEIFIGLYIDGRKNKDVAAELNMDRSNVGKIVSKYVD